MLPNFLIAGVTRSGTTSLYNYINQHPDISFPKLKEPRYFSSHNIKLPQKGPGDFSVDEKLIKSFSEYENLYSNLNSKLVGDASSEYLYNHKISIPEILNRLGDVPVILILRNPVERSFSAYNNLVRDGREKLSFEMALDEEDDRIINGFDEMWHYKSVSLYSDSVSHFLTKFSNVKIIIFEEFIENKSKFVNEVFEFLGVSPHKIDTSQAYSKSGKPKSKLVSIILGRNNRISNLIRLVLFKFFDRRSLEKLSKYFISKNDPIKPKTRKYLNQFFINDILKLENLLKINLRIWKN